MRKLPVTLVALALALACDSKPEEAPPEKKAGPTPEEIAKKEADEKAKKEADEKAKKEAEKKEKIKKSLAELEEAKAEEAERWEADKIADKAKKIAKKKHKNTKSGVAFLLKSPHRTPKNVERDPYRHPAETLAFLGVKPDMTVLEIGPGAGWYTEILAPLLLHKGKLVITTFDPKGPEDKFETVYARRIEAVLERSPELFGKVEKVVSPGFDEFKVGDGEALYDAVLVIRGMHGWAAGGKLEERVKEIHRVLKPGGIFGVVQHRAAEGAKVEDTAKKGYVPEAWLIEAVEKQGFALEEKSDLNANPKDTRDYPEGVWTLPPTLTLDDKDRDKYLEIGESDRMTLRFNKK